MNRVTPKPPFGINAASAVKKSPAGDARVLQAYFPGGCLSETVRTWQARVPARQHGVVQARGAGKGHAFPTPPNFLKGRAQGSGQPLPATVKSQMESFFQTDFSKVRVHVGSEAPAIGALAFTVGTDLYFAPGQYQPNSPGGKRLIGHELTHVVQQAQGRVPNPYGNGLAVVHDPRLEEEAEAQGKLAARHTGRSRLGGGQVQRRQAGAEVNHKEQAAWGVPRAVFQKSGAVEKPGGAGKVEKQLGGWRLTNPFGRVGAVVPGSLFLEGEIVNKWTRQEKATQGRSRGLPDAQSRGEGEQSARIVNVGSTSQHGEVQKTIHRVAQRMEGGKKTRFVEFEIDADPKESTYGKFGETYHVAFAIACFGRAFDVRMPYEKESESIIADNPGALAKYTDAHKGNALAQKQIKYFYEVLNRRLAESDPSFTEIIDECAEEILREYLPKISFSNLDEAIAKFVQAVGGKGGKHGGVYGVRKIQGYMIDGEYEYWATIDKTKKMVWPRIEPDGKRNITKSEIMGVVGEDANYITRAEVIDEGSVRIRKLMEPKKKKEQAEDLILGGNEIEGDGNGSIGAQLEGQMHIATKFQLESVYGKRTGGMDGLMFMGVPIIQIVEEGDGLKLKDRYRHLAAVRIKNFAPFKIKVKPFGNAPPWRGQRCQAQSDGCVTSAQLRL